MIGNDARATIVEQVRLSGTTLKSLSLMLGRNGSYIQQFVSRGTPRVLEPRDRRVLADHFGIDAAALDGELTARRRQPHTRKARADAPGWTVTFIAEHVAFEAGKAADDVLGSPRAFDLWLRRVSLWIARRAGRMSIEAIAGEIGRSTAAVSVQLRRARDLYTRDAEFRRLVDLVTSSLQGASA